MRMILRYMELCESALCLEEENLVSRIIILISDEDNIFVSGEVIWHNMHYCPEINSAWISQCKEHGGGCVMLWWGPWKG
jgi:hypothetical protein